jgi:hypothetical protein
MTNLGVRTGQNGLPGSWFTPGARRIPQSSLAKPPQNRTFHRSCVAVWLPGAETASDPQKPREGKEQVEEFA